MIIYFVLKLIAAFLAGTIAVIFRESIKHFLALALMKPIYKHQENKKLNVLKFIDPIGMVLFVFGYILWQKPEEYAANKFKNGHKDLLPIIIAGMIINIAVIIGLLPILKIINTNYITAVSTGTVNIYFATFLMYFVQYSIIANISLVIMNLLPVPPLDMTRLVQVFSPSNYFMIIQNKMMVQAIFILAIAFGIFGKMIVWLYSILTVLVI